MQHNEKLFNDFDQTLKLPKQDLLMINPVLKKLRLARDAEEALKRYSLEPDSLNN